MIRNNRRHTRSTNRNMIRKRSDTKTNHRDLINESRHMIRYNGDRCEATTEA
jgi:hypothetical protein